ncbi:MAG: hypothetical protein JJT75_06280 [Opitutales bacterium]|nr:hypothetical protein [Opitutales bacterium]MCH8539586.1 hypothetical protein [Opitutales bacterium]
MLAALSLIVFVICYRLLAFWHGDFVNFAPAMALVFCGALYAGQFRRLWIAPLVGLLLSDLYLNAQYGAPLFSGSMVVIYLGYLLALPIGFWISRNKSWLTILGGCLGASVLFYVLTNTASWAANPAYVKSLGGWFQALTVGVPGLPPTWMFFRSSVLSDLLFTGAFVVAMESVLAARGKPSLMSWGKSPSELREKEAPVG